MKGTEVIPTKREPKRIKNLLTVRQVAEQFGVTSSEVLRQIRLGHLPSQKLGWVHVIRRSDLPENWPPTAN